MKASHFTILFSVLMIAFLLPHFIGEEITTEASRKQEAYAQYLTNACITAASGSDMSDGLAFGSDAEREGAVSSFYNSLALSMNLKNTTTEGSLPYYVPAIILIDNDGFYVSYNEYDGNQYNNILTPVNTYTRQYGNDVVKFYLDGGISILDRHGEYAYFGNRQDAYDKYPSLSFLQTEEDYTEERALVVTELIKGQMEYYINYHNTNNRLYQASYTFSLPAISGQDWANLVDAPGVLSFLQGIKMSYPKGYVNVYALAGSRIKKSTHYVVSEDAGFMYYHTPECSHAPADPTRLFPSMESAAKYGATPCPDCIR